MPLLSSKVQNVHCERQIDEKLFGQKDKESHSMIAGVYTVESCSKDELGAPSAALLILENLSNKCIVTTVTNKSEVTFGPQCASTCAGSCPT